MMTRLALFALALTNTFAQHSDTRGIANGRRLFEESCTACHGQNAKGGRGPDLTGKLQHGTLEVDIASNITRGIPGTQMPAFAIPAENALAIARYLKSLQPQEKEVVVTGDADRGRQAFFGEAGCSRCHMYQGRGGRLGPDLSRAGGKSAGELQQLIARPHQELTRGFETMEVRLRGGVVVRGVRKNQDTFSLQMMDEHEKVHLLLKRDIADIRLTGQSLMPSPAASGSQLNNVIAFLKKAPHLEGTGEWVPSTDLNVTFQRLRSADREPQNWLSYWGGLDGTHHSGLSAITTANVKSLTSAWSYQFGGNSIETTPIVVDGIMFVTGPQDVAAALDARTGRTIWKYSRSLPAGVHSHCTVMTNRGVAILGDRLYLATLDAHLVALDAKTGNVIWDVPVADYKAGFSITHAPLAIDGRIAVGVTAGECALTGFVDAYDAASGGKLWRV